MRYRMVGNFCGNFYRKSERALRVYFYSWRQGAWCYTNDVINARAKFCSRFSSYTCKETWTNSVRYQCMVLAGWQWLLLLVNTGHAAMFLITPMIYLLVDGIFMAAKSTMKWWKLPTVRYTCNILSFSKTDNHVDVLVIWSPHPHPFTHFSMLHTEKREGLGGEITWARLHNRFVQKA